MAKTPEFFISHTIDTIYKAESTFNIWPLHVTIIPPFILNDISEEQVLEEIATAGHNLGVIELGYGEIRSGAIPVEIGNRAMFGEKENIPVVEIVDPSNKLHELHSLLLGRIASIGCAYINLNPEWTNANYAPHATMKSGVELDHPFFLRTLSLHKKDGADKQIVDTVKLHA